MAQSSTSSTLLDLSSLVGLNNSRVAILATEWNDRIVAEQVAGARRIADQAGAGITHELYVPGSFELPFAIKRFFEQVKHGAQAPQAIIAFGAVIRGGTPHFEYVCKAVTDGIVQLNLMLPVPIVFGILTLDHEAQAWERLGGPLGHKGEEAMITALKMARFEHTFE